MLKVRFYFHSIFYLIIVVKNKMKSVFGGKVCVDNIPWYNVGQNPLQGDMNPSRMEVYNDGSGVKPDNSLGLIE